MTEDTKRVFVIPEGALLAVPLVRLMFDIMMAYRREHLDLPELQQLFAVLGIKATTIEDLGADHDIYAEAEPEADD